MTLLTIGAFLVLTSLQPTPATPQPTSPLPLATSQPDDPILQWTPRLTALDPSNPQAYFLLAEDVAADSADFASRELAKRLFVLAYETDAKLHPTSDGTSRMGVSVCLALASISSRDDEKRWLVSLAEVLTDRRNAEGAASRVRPASVLPPLAAFDLATALGLARAGEGRRAEQLLEKPGVADVLARYDATPLPDGSIGSLQSFLRRAIRDWPSCPQCKNRRVVPSGSGKSGELVLCDTCRGNPGPKLSDADVANQLRVESSLLQGSQRSWAAQVLADAGAPLRDLDPSEIAGAFSVNPAKTIWRDGKWTEPPAPTKAP